jgi:hypothetical protein
VPDVRVGSEAAVTARNCSGRSPPDSGSNWVTKLSSLRARSGHSRLGALAHAENGWRRLDGQDQLPKVILNVKFNDGIEIVQAAA